MAHYVDYTKVIDNSTGKLLPDLLQAASNFNPDNYYDKAAIDSKITTTKYFAEGKPVRYIRIGCLILNGGNGLLYCGELQGIDKDGTNILAGLQPVESMSVSLSHPEKITDGIVPSSSLDTTSTPLSALDQYLVLDIGEVKNIVTLKSAIGVRNQGTLAIDVSLDAKQWQRIATFSKDQVAYSSYTDIDLRTTEIVPAWQLVDEDLQDQINDLNGRVTDLENAGPVVNDYRAVNPDKYDVKSEIISTENTYPLTSQMNIVNHKDASVAFDSLGATVTSSWSLNMGFINFTDILLDPDGFSISCDMQLLVDNASRKHLGLFLRVASEARATTTATGLRIVHLDNTWSLSYYNADVETKIATLNDTTGIDITKKFNMAIKYFKGNLSLSINNTVIWEGKTDIVAQLGTGSLMAGIATFNGKSVFSNMVATVVVESEYVEIPSTVIPNSPDIDVTLSPTGDTALTSKELTTASPEFLSSAFINTNSPNNWVLNSGGQSYNIRIPVGATKMIIDYTRDIKFTMNLALFDKAPVDNQASISGTYQQVTLAPNVPARLEIPIVYNAKYLGIYMAWESDISKIPSMTLSWDAPVYSTKLPNWIPSYEDLLARVEELEKLLIGDTKLWDPAALNKYNGYWIDNGQLTDGAAGIKNRVSTPVLAITSEMTVELQGMDGFVWTSAVCNATGGNASWDIAYDDPNKQTLKTGHRIFQFKHTSDRDITVEEKNKLTLTILSRVMQLGQTT